MIAHTSYVITPRRLRGLGQDPYQQWVQSLPASCWMNNDPSSGQIICPTPASVLQATAAMPIHQPSPENFVSPAVAATAANPTFVTNAVSDAPGLTAMTANLEGHLAQAVTYAMANRATLASIGDPTAYLNSVVAQYCSSAGGLYVDSPGNLCGQASSLVAKYAAELQAAISGAGASSTGTTTGTTYSQQNSGSSSNIPPSPGPGYVWDGTSWRYAPSGGGGVVNPSPASQPTTTGSSLTSPSSVLSLTNGASMQTGQSTSSDFIPGIPNVAIFIGGGAALVLLVLAVQR